MQENEQAGSEYISTQRLEAFSDGVFAIAITLLILEIRIPSKEVLHEQSLTSYLLQQWPKYFAYVFSFVILGIYWANHHAIFKLYTGTNHIFNLLNVLFLMTVSFLPYPTAIFGEFIQDATQKNSAINFYCLGIFLPSLTWNLMWVYASFRKRLIDKRLTPEYIGYLHRQFLISNILYFTALLISFVRPLWSVVIVVVLTLLYLLPPKRPQYL